MQCLPSEYAAKCIFKQKKLVIFTLTISTKVNKCKCVHKSGGQTSLKKVEARWGPNFIRFPAVQKKTENRWRFDKVRGSLKVWTFLNTVYIHNTLASQKTTKTDEITMTTLYTIVITSIVKQCKNKLLLPVTSGVAMTGSKATSNYTRIVKAVNVKHQLRISGSPSLL